LARASTRYSGFASAIVLPATKVENPEPKARRKRSLDRPDPAVYGTG
jgi:hypothetical protein